jgi:hypothetical protein
MAEAVDTDLIRDLVADSRRATHAMPSHSSMIPPEKKAAEPQRPRGTGWVEPSTARSGDWAFDKMMDAQDEKDRAELERKLGKPEPKA